MFWRKKKDYENPDIIDPDETPLEESSPQQTQEEEKKEELTGPYPKKGLDEMEKEVDKKIIDVIKKVEDPELGIDIWSLGLIYDIKGEENLDIVMTFTSPMCPYGLQMVDDLKSKLKEENYEANVEIVLNPMWEPTEDLRDMLGI
jgi:metal-sulfur cluster biosynthetic enzyme